jgi:hypothetical protein
MSLRQQAPTGSSLNDNAQSPSTAVVAGATPEQQPMKRIRRGPASSLIDKSKALRFSKIEILNSSNTM